MLKGTEHQDHVRAVALLRLADPTYSGRSDHLPEHTCDTGQLGQHRLDPGAPTDALLIPKQIWWTFDMRLHSRRPAGTVPGRLSW